jgi:methylmalonyl-CoA/ethylmalonyl-CoA epimerase
VPPDQDAKEFELRFGERLDFDILTTGNPSGDGAIARFLRKSGEGIQQIEIEVSSVDRAGEILISRAGLTAVYPATRPGANGTLVNFFLVAAPSNRKLLIELVQPAKSSSERG